MCVCVCVCVCVRLCVRVWMFAVQVELVSAGNITAAGNCSFTCPVAANFDDPFALYGPASYPVVSGLCRLSGGGDVLVSTLQFQCRTCGANTYSLQAGWSNGTAGARQSIACLQCTSETGARNAATCPRGVESGVGTLLTPPVVSIVGAQQEE